MTVFFNLKTMVLMKKTNFTNPKLVKNWLLVVALMITSYSVTQLSAQCQLNADDLIHVILSDDNCDATLTQEMFLSDDGAACTVANHYEFEVRSADGQNILIPMTQNAVLDYTYIGGPYMVIIEAHDANHAVLNTAMTTFDVADKMPPVFTCPTDTIEIKCYQQDTYFPPVADNCSPTNDIEIIKIDENIWDNNCTDPTVDPGVFRIIDRNFIARDASGNLSDTCHTVIRIVRLDNYEFATMIRFPDDLVKADQNAISCKDADSYKDAEGKFDPDKTGWPYLIYPDDHPTQAEQNANDDQDTVILNNTCTFPCNLASTYLDVNVNSCPECVEKTVRFWTVVETSCQYPERFRTNIQTIEVVDTIAPVIICPENRTITTNTTGDFDPVSAGQLTCGAWFTFPVPQMSDECSTHLVWTISVVNDMGNPVMFADTTETKTPVSRALPFGIDTVTYTVYDGCGNSSSCEWIVKVVDKTSPVAVCQQFTTVSLTYDGEAEIPAANFDSGSYDDCLIDRFAVRRMDNKINCAGDVDTNEDHFFDYVTFCCDDIADNDITVIMRVWDKGGNWNDCMVQVNVQDKLPPQITCPPSVCVECDYTFDVNNLDEYFGTVVQGYDNRETHTIYGDNGAFYFGSYDGCGASQHNLQFKDGWAHDNCGLDITSTYVDKRDQCNSGDIVRTFTASDPNGSVYCKQTIHFYNPDPFDKNDIHWPDDYTVTGCFNEAAYGPDITGWPTLTEDACDLAAATYKDNVFHFNDDNFDAEGVCFKVIRHWTVMDWCQRYPDNYPDPALAGKFYTWGWDQVIMVSETTPPEFTSVCEDKETCTYDSECKGGYIELTMSAHDECTQDEDLKWRYRIDLNNDGSFDIDSKNFTYPNNIISGASANASKEYPIGTHRIVWTVWDQCGNTAICDKLFTIKNCKKPTPRCVDHISIEMMPVDTDNDGVADWAMIDVGANLVEACCAKSSHPCGYPLKYSFTADTSDVLRTYDCDDIGLQDVQMWVTAILPDGSITQDYCVTHIDFQDNNGVCPATQAGTINVSGSVTTINDEPIPDVELDVQGSELAPQMTGNEGTFAFTVNADRNYIVAPSKDGDDMSGISTLDLVLIQKHILGLKTIDNPYLLLAANINEDDKVSASDILQLRRLILGSTNDLGQSWLFINKDYQFENPAKPYIENIPTETAINSASDININFYGIKMGDINNSLEMRSGESLVFATEAVNVPEGEIEVPVYAENFNDISGFQYSIKFNNSVLGFVGIEPGELKINNSNIGVRNIKNGILTMSWDNANGQTVSPDQVLFTLKFKANKAGKLQNLLALTSDITRKEAYTADLNVMNTKLKFRNAEADEFVLYQNSPNPFSVYTDINFNLPENSEAKLSIYDLTGKVIRVINGQFNKGMNTIRIKKSDLNVAGVLYYRLETEGFTATRKMVIIK